MATWRELPKPPTFRGTEEEKWRMLRSYLLKLVEALENYINSREGEKDGNV